MKKLLVVLAIIALSSPLCFAGSGLGVFGTYWDADDGDDPGMGGGLKFKMEMMPNINLELRGSYLQNFFDGGINEDLVMVPLEVDLVIDFPLIPDVLTLSAGGGIGYYIWPEYESTIPFVPGSLEPDIDPDDEFGYFLVGGAELKLNEQLSLFGEAKYNMVEMEEAEIDGISTSFDIDFTGLSFNAGLLLLW